MCSIIRKKNLVLDWSVSKTDCFPKKKKKIWIVYFLMVKIKIDGTRGLEKGELNQVPGWLKFFCVLKCTNHKVHTTKFQVELIEIY